MFCTYTGGYPEIPHCRTVHVFEHTLHPSLYTTPYYYQTDLRTLSPFPGKSGFLASDSLAWPACDLSI